MLLNVPTPAEQARRDELVRAGAAQRGRDRRRWIRRAAAVVAAVAVNTALGVAPVTAQGLPSWLLITEPHVDEGDTMTFEVFISRGGTVPGGFTVTPSFTDGNPKHSNHGTATSGTTAKDYTATANPATLTFKGTADERHSFTVATTEDSVAEQTEVFLVTLSVSGTEHSFQIDDATGFIRDDDSAVLTIDDASAGEGSGIKFRVTASEAVEDGFTVTPSFTDGTATEGTDYTENTAGISFTGTKNESKTFTVATTQDQLGAERDETFTVNLAVSGTKATVTATDTATGTIRNEPALSIADAKATEGNQITFTVTLDGAVTDGLTVTPSFTDGTATKGTDYTENVAALTFAGTAGETKQFTVPTTSDTTIEGDETFTVGLETSALVTATDTATGTILNDDAVLTIADAAADEGNQITFTVTLDGAVAGGLTVTPSFTGGTATSGTDYTENTAGISFAGTDGETQTFTVPTTQDSVVEGGETFTVSLAASGPSATVTATDTATGTIRDDDDEPEVNLSVNPSSASEGASATTVTVTAAFSTGNTFPEDETVTVSVGGGTATAGTDYAAVPSFGITIPKGATIGEATFTLRPIQDTAVEGNETIDVAGDLTVNGTALTVNGTELRLTDDDGPPEVNLTVSPATVREGASATTVTVTATLSTDRTFAKDETVTVSVGGGTATSGTDYATVSNFDITIRKGADRATGTFTLRPTQDTAVEGNETIDVAGSAGDLTVNGAELTLTDDDDAPAVHLSASPSIVSEGAGSTPVTVTATFSTDRTFTEDRTVTVSVGGGTATSDTDYAAVSSFDITIAGGANSGTGTFTLRPTQDTAVEGNETIDVAGSAGDLTVNGAELTLTDDDKDTARHGGGATLTIADASASEGDPLTFTVTLDQAVSGGLTVTPRFTDGTATKDADYTGNTAALSFDGTAGETRTFTVATIEDQAAEADETFAVSLAVSGTTATVTATGTIADDDHATVTVGDANAAEGDALTFTVTLDRAVAGGLTVWPAFTDGTADKGADYTENTTALTFAGAPGETRTLIVATTEDTDVEPDETFTVSLTVSGTTATVIATDTATATITDDDRRETSGVAAALTVADASASEGDPLTFTVTLIGAVPGGLTVSPGFADGTATKGADYTENTAALSFDGTAGETRTFTVATTEDQAAEADETFAVSLAVSGTTATVTATDTATATITDDDHATVTVGDANAAEGDALTFTVTLDRAVAGGLTVWPAFTDGTADKGADYTENTTALTFAGALGESRTLIVATTEDTDVETDETFTVSLTVSGTTATVIATDTATATITDDDDATVTVGDASAAEGDALTFTVTLVEAVAGGLTVTPRFTDGTAIRGADYTENTTALTFAGRAGETRTFNVTTIEDEAAEADETFTVGLSVAGTSASVTATATATATITDDDDATVTVADANAAEGDALTFTVTLDKAVAGGLTVTPRFTDGTAIKDADYTENTTALTFAGRAGETRTLTVGTTEDQAAEAEETFTVGLSVAGTSASVTATATATATIMDDDDATVTVGDASAAEGDVLTFTVTLDKAVAGGLTVTPRFTDGTATKGTDYTENTARITFAGRAGETRTFTVATTDDGAVEPDETFTVNLSVSGTSAAVTDTDTATGTIDNDDLAPAVNLSVNPSSVSEGGASTPVTVTAAFSTDKTFTEDRTVTVSVGGGTATSGTDYATVSDLDVTIAGGASSGTGTFMLTPIGDGVVEGDETVEVAGSAGDLTVNGAALTLTDSTPRLRVSAARAVEGETMVFTVSLQSPGPRAVTVQYATVDGTATAGADYTSTSGQLVFSADETERQVSVPIVDDVEVEDNETFALAVHLADAAGSSASATGTVLENDVLTLSVTAPDVQEADGPATFTGSLSSASPYRIVVHYGTSDGTATAGADYVETTGELAFEPGETEKAVVVPVMDDDLVEGTETLLLSMTVVPAGSRSFGSSAAEAPPFRLVGLGTTDRGNATSLQVTGTIRDDELAQTRAAGTSPALHLLARSIASEAVAAIGERFAATGGDTPRAGLGAAPAASGRGGTAAGVGVAYPAAPVSGAAGAGALAGSGQGAMALHRPSDEPFADLGWLDNARFSAPLGEAGESGGWQVWGRAGTVRSRLQSRTGGQARGDVFSTHVGVDTRLGGSALLGASVSHTVGLLGYTAPNPLARGASPGEGDGSVTSVQPYAHWAPRDGLTLWGMGGGGRGSLTLADSAGTVETPLGFRMFAGGARQALTTGLALKADAFHATLRSAERADLAAATGTAIRGRMLAEGQADWALSDSSSLTPRLEAGLRWDGGTDVEGMGAEMGAGVAYVNRRLNLGLETQGRYLVAHQAEGFEEWGAGLSVRVGPGVDRPGPWLALAPEWGASDSRVNALWDPRAAPELHRGAGGTPGAGPDRLAASAGYRVSDAGGVAVEALHETRPGDDGGVAVRVTGNLSWGGADGGPRAGGGAPRAERQVPVRRGAVAVAAFENVSGSPADQWIGAGVTETLTSALGQVDALSVVGDGEAGAAPPAWRVAGEYRRWGDRVRIDARVVDMRTGAVAARSREEGAPAELFELLDRMTVELAGALAGLSADGGAGGGAPSPRELPGGRRDVRGSEGGGAPAATRWALAGSRAAGIAPARPSTAVRLETVDEARPSSPRSSGRRPTGSRDTAMVQARPSSPRSSGRRPTGSRDTAMVQARPSSPGRLDEARPSAPVRPDTVAIEPFRSVLRAQADDWLGLGVTETLTIALEQLDGIEVVGDLGTAGPEAAWLVTGVYHRRGERLQMDARVVDTRTGAVAARSSVDGAAVDFFDMQDRITADLAAALGNLSTGGEPGRREPESRAARAPADASRSPRDILSLRRPLGPPAEPGLRGGLPAALDW